MNLGFYYHLPIVKKDSYLYIDSFLGVFIDSLASNVNHLTLIMHEANDNKSTGADYKLVSQNIVFVSLGVQKPAWHRSFFPGNTLKNIEKKVDCDLILVRSPTPLATSFKKFFSKQYVVFLIVGDYLESGGHSSLLSLRDVIISQYLKHYDKQFNKIISESKILVNSPALLKKYSKIASIVSLVNTTTISYKDITHSTKNINKKEEINILFTGRIDPTKGLFELVEAISLLNGKYQSVVLNIVGWEELRDKPVENKIRELSFKLGINDKIVFHGRKKVGPELFSYYKKNDIYVLPSYQEGFPRTIWEAMANGIPVIATLVGGIPELIESGENCLLIPPKNIQEIVKNIELLVENPDLVNKLVLNAYNRVTEVTLENQSNKIVKLLKYYINE